MVEKKSKSKNQIVWRTDATIIAKYAACFVVILYARWVLATFFLPGEMFGIQKGFITGGDFVNYWAGPHIALQHHVMTLFDIQGYHKTLEALFGRPIEQFYNWSYPPHFLMMILWLGLFPYPVALTIWIAGTFALYAFAVAYKRPKSWTLTLILALSPAAYANFSVGQNGFLSGALLVGGLRLLSVNPILAGIAFGCLSFKPQIGILIPFALLAAGQWRAFASAAVTTLALVGASILAFGTEPWIAYIQKVIPYQRMLLELNPHTMPFTNMYPTFFMAARIFGAPLVIAYGVAVVSALAALAVAVYAFKFFPTDKLRNSIFLSATFLASPYLFFYDMPAFSAGIIGTVAASGQRLKSAHIFLLVLAYFIPLVVFPLDRAGIPVTPFIIAGVLGLQLSLMKSTPRR